MSKCRRFKLFIVAAIALAAVVGISFWQGRSIDAGAILAHSVLKDKTFGGKVQQIETDGMKAYLLEEHSNPIVAVSFMFENAGSAYEPENKQGLTALLSEMLLNGAGEYEALRFKDISEEYGIKLGFGTSDDAFDGYLQMPKNNLGMGIKLFTAALYKPHFTLDYIALGKKQMQTAIRNYKERPEGVLADKFSEIIFAGHPYSRPAVGKPETVAGLNRGDLLHFMRSHFTKNNLLIGIAGDINAAEAEQLIRDLFGRLPRQCNEKTLAEYKIESSGATHYIDRVSPQAITAFVTTGTHRNSEDFYPLYVANYIFGGSGLNSRISKVIREENGLTYGIYTYLSNKKSAVSLAGGYAATPENFEKARQLLLQQWQQMAQKGVTAEELQQAKDALISSHNLRFASTGGIAEMLVVMQQYNLGADFLEKRNDYIRNLTLEQVNAAAAKYYATAPDFVIIGALQTTEKGEE